MGVRKSVNGSGGKVSKISISDILRHPVFISAVCTNPCLHACLDLIHGFADGLLKRIEDGLFILGIAERIDEAYRLAGIEGKIIAHRPVHIITPGECSGGEGIPVVAKTGKIPLDYVT